MQYTQLINALEHGFHVLVKDSDEYLITSPFKDGHGDWRHSGHWYTPEDAKQNIGIYGGISQEELQKKCPDWELVGEPFIPPYKRWEKGDEVIIADNAKELCEKAGLGWKEEMQEMVGKKCEVKSLLGNNYKVWNEDKSDLCPLPHEALLPVFDEEEEVTIRIYKKSLKALEESGIKIIK